MSDRIEGEFYYAELRESPVPGGFWVVKRKSDDFQIAQVAAEFWEPEAVKVTHIDPADEQARHFIALGKAEERKHMIDELEDAATDCDGHTPYSILMALAKEARERGER